MSSPEIDDFSISFWKHLEWMYRTSDRCFDLATNELFIIPNILIFLFVILHPRTNWNAELLTGTSLHNLWEYKWYILLSCFCKSAKLWTFLKYLFFFLLNATLRRWKFNGEINEFIDIFLFGGFYRRVLHFYEVVYCVGNSANEHETLVTG